jgi:hypothetical protein
MRGHGAYALTGATVILRREDAFASLRMTVARVSGAPMPCALIR